MKSVTVFLLIVSVLCGCAGNEQQRSGESPDSLKSIMSSSDSEKTAQSIPEMYDNQSAIATYKIIDAPNGTFGYDIYLDNRLTIHQPSKPGLPGNEGFTTKEKAQKIAMLVISKIKNGEMPPTVTIEEMKKLKAID